VVINSYINYYKKNLKLAIPVVFSQAGQVTVSLVDNMMVGHAGTTELAAASFSNSIFVLGLLFGLGITMGITPLVGRLYSKNEKEEVASYFKNGFLLHVIVALGIILVMSVVGLFLDQMGQPDDVAELSYSYFMVLVCSLFPLLLFFSGKQFLEGIGNTKIAMAITLGSNLVNVVLNYLLIFGKFGFPELGLLGAGIATLIARMLMPVFLFFYLRRNKGFSGLTDLAIGAKLEFRKVMDLLKVGFPIGVQIVIEVLTFSFGAVMMGWIGEAQLAAHQIAIGMASFTYMISLGIGAATTIRVSHAFGVGESHEIRKTMMASLHMIVVFMSFMGIIFIFCRNLLPWMFTKDVAVIQIAADLLIIAALFQVFDGLQVALLSALRGLSDVKMPMLMAFFSYSVIGVPVSYGCAFLLGFGSIGIWIGFLVGLIAAALFFGWRLKRLLFAK